MNGIMIVPNKEYGDKIPISIIAISIFGPYICNFQANSGLFFEIILPNIWEPSKGAIGSMLNTAKAMLIHVNNCNTVIKTD